jgi:hypothetical protein
MPGISNVQIEICLYDIVSYRIETPIATGFTRYWYTGVLAYRAMCAAIVARWLR